MMNLPPCSPRFRKSWISRVTPIPPRECAACSAVAAALVAAAALLQAVADLVEPTAVVVAAKAAGAVVLVAVDQAAAASVPDRRALLLLSSSLCRICRQRSTTLLQLLIRSRASWILSGRLALRRRKTLWPLKPTSSPSSPSARKLRW